MSSNQISYMVTLPSGIQKFSAFYTFCNTREQSIAEQNIIAVIKELIFLDKIFTIFDAIDNNSP